VLVVQHDGFIVRPESWDRKFLQYDYIGAPWDNGIVGNGGFSLRSKRLLDVLAEMRDLLTWPHPEDGALCCTYRDELESRGILFAPTDVARRFSVEDEAYQNSFGLHGYTTQCLSGLSLDGLEAQAARSRPHKRAGQKVTPQTGASYATAPSRTDLLPTLQRLFDQARKTPSDFNEHVETLARLARDCVHITEFGLRLGVSTKGLLYGRPQTLVSYDYKWYDTADVLASAAHDAGVHFRFIHADVLSVEIDDTDLLFIDTIHTYSQLTTELQRHAHRVRRYLVFHDTTTFGTRGEDGGPGIWPAIEDFLFAHPFWQIQEKYENNNGLTVLRRTDFKERRDDMLDGANRGTTSARQPPDGGVVVDETRELDAIVAYVEAGEHTQTAATSVRMSSGTRQQTPLAGSA
jgi:hypothetical protein